jgi:hypothetical protein
MEQLGGRSPELEYFRGAEQKISFSDERCPSEIAYPVKHQRNLPGKSMHAFAAFVVRFLMFCASSMDDPS